MSEEKNSNPENNGQLNLTARVEAILFVAPEPLSAYQIGSILDESTHTIGKVLEELQDTYHGRGIRLQYHDNKVRLTSAPEASQVIEQFLNLESTTTLSQAALETLSIIAYQQPVTRPQIDAIRGVNSDGVLRTLLSKGLVEDVGRAESPGRPILYSASAEFLRYFGLSSFDELPPLDMEEFARDQDIVDPQVLKD
jgi:segregation and condensation protein B